MPAPTIHLILTPDGTLTARHPSGGPPIPLPPEPPALASALREILFDLATSKAQLARTGRPTALQAECWSRHSTAGKATCPLCRAKGRPHSYGSRHAGRDATARLASGADSYSAITRVGPEDLGL